MFWFGNDESLNLNHAPFLLKMDESDDNTLKLIVSLACVGEKEDVNLDLFDDTLKNILSGAKPIFPSNDEIFEIIFEDYILHLTRNESYTSFDPKEIRKGRYFISYNDSKLLDILPLITDCQFCTDGSAYPGYWKHYGILCQNHIIDVISHNTPTIRRITNERHAIQ